MDTGLLHNNCIYYEGFEGEDEVILSLESDREISVHIWVGYLDDILRDPVLDESDWTGFTRDYHQLEGAFSQEGKSVAEDPAEYLEDIQHYAEKNFDEPETKEVFQLIVNLLKYAMQEKTRVLIRVN